MKRVMVGDYTYETDLDLKVGDEVVIPTPDFLRDVKGPTFKGKITSLTSTYNGSCIKILRRA